MHDEYCSGTVVWQPSSSVRFNSRWHSKHCTIAPYSFYSSSVSICFWRHGDSRLMHGVGRAKPWKRFSVLQWPGLCWALKVLSGIPFSVYKVQEEERLTLIFFFCRLKTWSHTLKIAERGADVPNTLEKGVKYFYFQKGGQVKSILQENKMLGMLSYRF